MTDTAQPAPSRPAAIAAALASRAAERPDDQPVPDLHLVLHHTDDQSPRTELHHIDENTWRGWDTGGRLHRHVTARELAKLLDDHAHVWLLPHTEQFGTALVAVALTYNDDSPADGTASLAAVDTEDRVYLRTASTDGRLIVTRPSESERAAFDAPVRSIYYHLRTVANIAASLETHRRSVHAAPNFRYELMLGDLVVVSDSYHDPEAIGLDNHVFQVADDFHAPEYTIASVGGLGYELRVRREHLILVTPTVIRRVTADEDTSFHIIDTPETLPPTGGTHETTAV